MIYAWLMMSTNGQGGFTSHIATSQQYEFARKAYTKQITGEGNPFFGKIHDPKTIDQIKKKNTGRKRTGASIDAMKKSFNNSEKFKERFVEVKQYTRYGKLIATYKSMHEASRLSGVNVSTIYYSCIGQSQVSKGYVWRYVNDEFNKFGEITSNKRHEKIVQLSNDKQFIKQFDSIKSASKELNIVHSSISYCCSGKYHTAGGFKWMYLSDYEQLVENSQR